MRWINSIHVSRYFKSASSCCLLDEDQLINKTVYEFEWNVDIHGFPDPQGGYHNLWDVPETLTVLLLEDA